MNTRLRLVEPCNENRQVEPMPRRVTNAEMRTREYLTPAEIEKLIKAAKDGRWGHRDATLVLVAYRHGLRAREASELEWSQVEFGRSAALHVRRAKNGKPSVHPIRGDELRMLTALRKEFPDSGYVFTTERGTPFTPDAINRLVKTIGNRAGLPMPVHFHMLRHSCGYMPWPIAVSTQGQSRTGLATSRSPTPPGTPHSAPFASRTSGAIKQGKPVSAIVFANSGYLRRRHDVGEMAMVKLTVDYDDEAKVWFVKTSDLSGVHAEGETLDDLCSKLPAIVSDLIENRQYEKGRYLLLFVLRQEPA